MTLRHWLARLGGFGRIEAGRVALRGRGRRRRAAWRNAPACVETLEERTLLTAYVVNTIADTVDATDGLISLREAITAANTNAASGNASAGSVDGDVITFSLNTLQPLKLNPALGQYEITDDLLIDGSPNPTRIVLSGELGTRVFRVNASFGPGVERRVEFRDFDIVAGQAIGAGGTGGGAILVDPNSDLTLRRMNVSRSTAASGGGVFNAGNLSLVASWVVGNTAYGNAATDGGGGIFNAGGTVTVTGNSLIDRNRAVGGAGAGGGIANVGGGLRMVASAVVRNTATRAGGGIETRSAEGGGGGAGRDPSHGVTLTDVNLSYNLAGPNFDGTPMDAGDGGGMHSATPGGVGTVMINGGTILGNIAGRGGGGVWSETTLMAVTGTQVRGNVASRGFDDGTTVNAGGGLFSAGRSNAERVSTVTDSLIRDNIAATFGGRLGLGGGLASAVRGRIRLTDTLVLSNRAGLGAGVHNADAVDVTGGTIDLNIAARNGGGIFNAGFLSLNRTSIVQNEAQGGLAGDGGGGVFNAGGQVDVFATSIISNSASGALGSGGGIHNGLNGLLRVTNSTLRFNGAARSGGGIEDNAAAADPANVVQLAGVFIERNSAGFTGAGSALGAGGGFHGAGAGVVTMFRNVITRNRATQEGGGVWLDAGGSLRMDETTVSDNTADTGDGGGLFLRGTAGIATSLIALNTAGRHGGGIWVNDALSLVNSTVGENRAGGSGGGVYVAGDAATTGAVLIGNATIVRNRADFDGNGAGLATGGGLFVAAGENVTLHNTVVALNLVGADPTPGRDDIFGTTNATSSFNFIGDGTGSSFVNGVNGNQVGTAAASIDPRLGPLANNSGPTRTYAPAEDSPLLDRGRDVLLSGQDQRFLPRPFDRLQTPNVPGGDGSDIGAVEFQPLAVT